MKTNKTSVKKEDKAEAILLYKASSRNVAYSPYKLRPIVNVIRQKKNLHCALQWLSIYRQRRSIPIDKLLRSVFANAHYQNNQVQVNDFVISDIRVDHGMMRKYMKPSAQGRGMLQRRRSCHLSVAIKKIETKGNKGS